MMLHCNNTQPDINRIPQQKNSLNIGFPVAMPSIPDDAGSKELAPCNPELPPLPQELPLAFPIPSFCF
jgi:hypothetical protein